MQLQKCIGSAVLAMGPERFLTLVPISLDEHSLTYSNIWLVPILKRYVTGASLAYYMDRIMPLAKTFKQASRKGIFPICALCIYTCCLRGVSCNDILLIFFT